MSKTLSALCVCLLLAASAHARRQAQESRAGDKTHESVQSVRTETAEISLKDGQPWEGPRRLLETKTYSPDGRRTESVSYLPDGTVRLKTVRVFDERGLLAEQSNYDAADVLLNKEVHVRRGYELAVYDGEGRLLRRIESIWNEKRNRVVEIRSYDGSGALVRRDVNTISDDGTRPNWASYGPGGEPLEKTDPGPNPDGPKRAGQARPGTDAADGGGRDETGDAPAGDRKPETDADGQSRRGQKAKREYDSRRNLVKVTYYRWDEAGGKLVPRRVVYHNITYRQ